MYIVKIRTPEVTFKYVLRGKTASALIHTSTSSGFFILSHTGCYYGKALDANPNDPFYFSTTDKAMLAFVKRQTPFL